MGKHFYKSLSNVMLIQIYRFVSRANLKTNDRHVILGVVGWKPHDFAQQMNLRLYEALAGSFEDGGEGEIIEEAEEVNE